MYIGVKAGTAAASPAASYKASMHRHHRPSYQQQLQLYKNSIAGASTQH